MHFLQQIRLLISHNYLLKVYFEFLTPLAMRCSLFQPEFSISFHDEGQHIHISQVRWMCLHMARNHVLRFLFQENQLSFFLFITKDANCS